MQKRKISNPLLPTRKCAYQGVRNSSFWGNFAYFLKGFSKTFQWFYIMVWQENVASGPRFEKLAIHYSSFVSNKKKKKNGK